jgi:hypothetical protein
MAPEDKIYDTIKFLLSSVKKLSDSFVESEGKFKRNYDNVSSEVEQLRRKLEQLERELAELGSSVSGEGQPARVTAVETHLPVAQGTAEYRIPVLNLSEEAIAEIYANTPILLEPFSRPCSLTGRTLSGEIEEVELEMFAQGTTWVVESLPAGWLLIPRPGSLERKTSLQSLEKLYVISGVRQLPVQLHLISPARLTAVVVGRRWQLRQKGQLSVSPDPLRVALSDRMASLEQRLASLEDKKTR